MTFYVLSGGTKGNPGNGGIYWLDKDGKGIPGAGKSVRFKPDFPFWEKYTITGTIPDDAALTASDTSTYYEDGGILVDDVSIKVNGKEVVVNGGFEDR